MSKCIKSENVKFKGAYVAYALIAAVAASATVTVHAADPLYWTGGEKATSTEESPYNIWDSANWGGYTPSRDYNPDISANGTTYLNSGNGGTIGNTTYLNSGDYVFTGSLNFYNGLIVGTNDNSTVSITKKSGDWTANYGDIELGKANNTTVTFVNESGNVTFSRGRINLGGSSDSSGSTTLTIKGGTVTVPSNRGVQLKKGTGTINLDGGTLVTPKVERLQSNGTKYLNLNFNGGTLKANASENLIYSPVGYLNVVVNAGGGTIDSGGNAVTIGACPNSGYFNGEGGLTFTGGNTITLKREVSYSGATRVTPGTTLAVENETAKNNILSHGLVVTDIPMTGQTVFTYTSALDNADLTKVSCPCAPATTFRFSDEGKTNIVVDVVVLDWTKYSHRFKVSFSGYAGSETLEDFPVLVKISESGISGFRYADCKKPGGADLRFADASGNLLASEVDTWDTNGVSLVWVNVPSLTAATKITAYYGWDIAPVVDSKAVWANGYVAVWHLNETSLPLAESSGKSTPFEAPSGTENRTTYATNGVAGGKAVSFDNEYIGNTNDRLIAADDPDLRGLTNITVECWTYQTKYRDSSGDATIIGNLRNWKLYQQSTGEIGCRWMTTGGSYVNNLKAPSAIALGEWTHSTLVRNFTGASSADSALYMNGESVATYSESSGATSTGNGSAVGHRLGTSDGLYTFPGSIDEVRVSNVARSADWVKASHDTVTESSFARYGSAGENVDKGLMIFVR